MAGKNNATILCRQLPNCIIEGIPKLDVQVSHGLIKDIELCRIALRKCKLYAELLSLG